MPTPQRLVIYTCTTDQMHSTIDGRLHDEALRLRLEEVSKQIQARDGVRCCGSG